MILNPWKEIKRLKRAVADANKDVADWHRRYCELSDKHGLLKTQLELAAKVKAKKK